MKLLNKLTIKNLIYNKKRTIVTIIGILLSTALICAVSGMVTSLVFTLKTAEEQQNGTYHAAFYDVPKEDFKYLKNHQEITEFYQISSLGFASIKEPRNPEKIYAYLASYDDLALKESGLWLSQGRLPLNNQEIVISEGYNSNFEKPYKVGDTLTLKVGKRVKDGQELGQEDAAFDLETGNFNQEELVDLKEYTFKIVGIANHISDAVESYHNSGYVLITTKFADCDKASFYVKYRNPKKYMETTKEIAKVEGDNSKYKYTTHEFLLGYMGYGLGEETTKTLIFLASVVIGIIMVSSIFVIKNSFAISITERLRQYGMLASIGATSKQIRKNVFFEGLILGLVAIPLGILCGILADYILIQLVNFLLKDAFNEAIFLYKVPLVPILLAIILSLITILLSSLIPALKASRIAPIEAIRSNQDIKIKTKKLKTPKWVMKIFKIGGVISYKNLKRNKKKYRTTVISIVVSVGIFISLSTFIDYGFKASKIYYQDINYNFEIDDYTTDDSKENYQNLISLTTKISAEKMSLIRYILVEADKKHFSKHYAESGLIIVSLGNQEYQRYLKELNLPSDFNEVILIDDATNYYNKKYVNYRQYNLNKGDEMTVKSTFDDEIYKLNIGLVTKVRPTGFMDMESGLLIVSDDYFDNLSDNYQVRGLNLKTNQADKLEKQLDTLKEEEKYYGISYYNLEKEAEVQHSLVLIVAIFLYGFIAVITLIGITNIFNTITTNMLLRQKEFAMLKSIGMTKKEFRRMIRLESIFYGTKALLIGIPLGILGSYAIYYAFTNSLETTYDLPIVAIFLSIILVYVFVGITMYYAMKKQDKQNIIETIRSENI